MTASELMAERERRLRDDAEYRAQAARVEAQREERRQRLRGAEQPVLDDLAAAGVKLDSVWSLHEVPELRAVAIPVLLRHLALDYPDPVVEGIGVGLADRSVRPWWSEMKALYLRDQRSAVRDRLAAALAECATREHYDDLVSFVANASLGQSRIYLLRPVNRIGNGISAGQGRSVIESLSEDPVLGKEATAILKGRSRNQ